MSDRQRIVHIDDNQGDLTLAHEAFAAHRSVRHEGLADAIGAIGKLAHDTVNGSPPALILLDLNLCGMDGFDVLRLLAANRRLKRIPVVILTSSDRNSERDTCLLLGAKAFIAKPATFEGMCEVAKSMLRMLGGSHPGDVAAEAAAPAAVMSARHGGRC